MKKLILMCVVLGATGCWKKADHPEVKRLTELQDDMNSVLLDAAAAGLAEAERRGATDLPELPETARTPDGELHPTVRQYAMDGDGRLRAKRDEFASLESHVKQQARWVSEIPVCMDSFCPPWL